MKLPMMRAVFVFSALLAVALLVSGCAGRSLSHDEQQSLAEAATAAPKLQPGDKIRVTVFGEDKLSGEYELDQSGQISLPLAGTVQALGLTQAELEHALTPVYFGEAGGRRLRSLLAPKSGSISSRTCS
jgi:polysaccharide biosynthesis/export protein